MALVKPDADFGRMAFEIAERVKSLLVPLEDVCRYREQRREDFASFDAKPREKEAIAFSVAIAPGGVNIVTPFFTLRELPVTGGHDHRDSPGAARWPGAARLAPFVLGEGADRQDIPARARGADDLPPSHGGRAHGRLDADRFA